MDSEIVTAILWATIKIPIDIDIEQPCSDI